MSHPLWLYEFPVCYIAKKKKKKIPPVIGDDFQTFASATVHGASHDIAFALQHRHMQHDSRHEARRVGRPWTNSLHSGLALQKTVQTDYLLFFYFLFLLPPLFAIIKETRPAVSCSMQRTHATTHKHAYKYMQKSTGDMAWVQLPLKRTGLD